MQRFSLWLSSWFLLGFNLATIAIWAQEAPPINPHGTFLEAAVGLGWGRFTDRGVSPLVYDGFLYGGMGQLVLARPRGEVRFGGGILTGNISQTNIFTTIGNTDCFTYHFQALRRLGQPNSGGQALLLGLQFSGWTNGRNTPSFNNAATVWESLNTLALAVKGQWNIPLNQDGRKFLWLFPTRPGQRLLQVNTQLNLPLVHTSWRPEFAYIDDFTNGETNYLERNSLYWGGWRFSWQTGIHYFLFNGNTIMLSYQWDAQRQGESFNRLEIAQHYLLIGVGMRLSAVDRPLRPNLLQP